MIRASFHEILYLEAVKYILMETSIIFFDSRVPRTAQKPTPWSYSPVSIYLHEENNADFCLNKNEVKMKRVILIERVTSE